MRTREVDLREPAVDETVERGVVWRVARLVGQNDVKVDRTSLRIVDRSNIDEADRWWA